MVDLKNIDPVFLRVTEAAKLAKMSPKFLYNEIASGKGPPIKRFGKGRMMRIPYKSFLAWAERTPKGTPNV